MKLGDGGEGIKGVITDPYYNETTTITTFNRNSNLK